MLKPCNTSRLSILKTTYVDGRLGSHVRRRILIPQTVLRRLLNPLKALRFVSANTCVVTVSLNVVTNKSANHRSGRVTATARNLTSSFILQHDHWSGAPGQHCANKKKWEGVFAHHVMNIPITVIESRVGLDKVM